LFKNALDLSSSGKFNLALQEWNQYLDSYPDDAAGFSNRGNDLRYDVSISLEDAYKGTEKNVRYTTYKSCKSWWRRIITYV